MKNPIVEPFFDQATNTMTYGVFNPDSRTAVVIDPVWHFNEANGKLSGESVQTLTYFIQKNSLCLKLILETHAHADHITGAQLLKANFPDAKIGIGKHITSVQATFKKVFHLSDEDVSSHGSEFDLLLEEGPLQVTEDFLVQTLFTPGHTPACVSYLIGDALFTGDALFMPDSGTGRCDFPGGSAKTLFHSVHEKIYALPSQTRVFVGHDYQPQGRPLAFETTVGEQARSNVHIKTETTESVYIDFRNKRDATLSSPRLLLPSLQINIRAGRLPKPESNGVSFLKLPLTILPN